MKIKDKLDETLDKIDNLHREDYEMFRVWLAREDYARAYATFEKQKGLVDHLRVRDVLDVYLDLKQRVGENEANTFYNEIIRSLKIEKKVVDKKT